MDFNKPSNEEILQALRTLKTLCVNSVCEDCPCYRHGTCKLQFTSPESYDLNEPEERWYAFRD
jgi:hypothetical protein